MKFIKFALIAAASLMSATGMAQEATSSKWAPGTIYGGAGLPGIFLGYSQPISDRFAVRGDFATMGSRNESVVEDDIRYEGKVNVSRVGLFADYYVLGGLRLTGGATFNNVKFDLTGRSATGTVDIGGTQYLIGTEDRVNVQVKFPKVTPYVGIGYGYAPKSGKGFGFAFDLGMSIGSPKVTGSATGPNLDGQVTQADLDRELDEVRDDVAKIKGIPQVSIAISYRF